MFDHVSAETKLVRGQFQSKSGDCQLDNYKITDEFLYIYKNKKWYKHPWFTGNFEFYTYKDRKMQEYVAKIEEGIVVSIINKEK